MPELPEVETVCRGLSRQIARSAVVTSLRFLSPRIRSPLPVGKAALVAGQKITTIKRRAKYLIIELENLLLLSHLGMTGSWRFENFCHLVVGREGPKMRNHDHIEIDLADGRVLIYRDPRRFGQFDIINKELGEDRRFSRLGPEPLDPDKFSADYLYHKTRSRRGPIKSFIMDQQVVVGVGNIYASEVLYFARVHPLKQTGKLTKKEAERVVCSIREVLGDAIAFGGSTIGDFRQAGGSAGYFQNIHLVYNCSGQPCAVCDTPIASRVVAGRSTFWCPQCQRM